MQLFLPDNVSEEKINFLRTLGAKLEVFCYSLTTPFR